MIEKEMSKEYYKQLIEKYLSGSISSDEYRDLSEWIEQDRELNHWWERKFIETEGLLDFKTSEKMFTKIRHKTFRYEVTDKKQLEQNTFNKNKIVLNLIKWVAIICIPIGICFSYLLINDFVNKEQVPLIVKTERGEKSTIILPDGTNVILNSSSRLKYSNDYGKKNRSVDLEGEAYFDVTRDTKKEFIVHTNNLDIKVIGTSFNISSYTDTKDITIVLLKGKVKIQSAELSYIMSPGEKIKYNKNTKKIIKEDVFPTDYITWTKGDLYFEKESLENIIKTISRVYNVDVQYNAMDVKDVVFSGTIPKCEIKDAMNMITSASSFTYQMTDSIIRLKKK
ncbi:FecR family protein [Parabacteroides sp. BX2]|jgi:transmembrane sensor|uniref:FecR family protein n=1 Tax=Parabacteroides segnis TaxID=2763058 RepID=A0ABR7E946_9BACT|nr:MULTISPECIES: FecR family protein [Parabacteroides]MBC5646308.1 FecR family protein [Parabacteroides segnis]MCM0716265.1 FecR family protein [Parabacteroides sp. TA-V-105]